MSERGPSLLLGIVVVLALAACLVLVGEVPAQRQRDQTAKEFHGLVGGLGFGPAVDLSRCSFSFDPRMCPSCSQHLGPIPGGVYFCPQHACSILYYRALERRDED